jgi:Spy/CpxP family protein refolding chaperone
MVSGNCDFDDIVEIGCLPLDGGALDISPLMGFTSFRPKSLAGAEKGNRRFLPECVQESVMKLAGIASVFILMFCLVTEGQAQSVGRDAKPDPSLVQGREVSAAKELNMTEAQLKDAKRIRATYSNRILKLRSEIIGKSIEYRNLLRDPAASEEAIRAKGKEIEAIDTQLIRERIDFEIEMRRILTPEQFQRWYTAMDQQPAAKKPVR